MKQHKQTCKDAGQRGWASKYGLYDCKYDGKCEEQHSYQGQVFCKRELERAVERGKK